MKLKIITVGRAKSGAWKELIDDYEKRISQLVPFESVSVRESKGDKGVRLKKEADAVFSKIREDEVVFVLDPRGRECNTEEIILILKDIKRNSRNCAFVIGSHAGVHTSLLKRADYRISLSQFTYSHMLARLVLLEQVYRVLTVLRGHPYHRS